MKFQHLRSLMFSSCVMTMPLMCGPGELVGTPAQTQPESPKPPQSPPDVGVQPKKLVITPPSRPKTTHLADRF